jgi:putative FmdB family regulatory protein
MPTYPYICENCKHEFDEFQKITDDALVICPKCKKKTLKRAIGGGNATFRFEGSGFYCTDYKDKKCNLCKEEKKCNKEKNDK